LWVYVARQAKGGREGGRRDSERLGGREGRTRREGTREYIETLATNRLRPVDHRAPVVFTLPRQCSCIQVCQTILWLTLQHPLEHRRCVVIQTLIQMQAKRDAKVGREAKAEAVAEQQATRATLTASS
jgi:hypothetical protein